MRLLLFAILSIVLITMSQGCATMGGENSDIYYVTTDDNWKLALKHVRGGSDKPPVILCHGLNYNDRFYTLNPEISLAAYLAQAGYDVWIVSLRGSGSSTKWVFKLAERGMQGYELYQQADEENWMGLALGGIQMLSNLAQDQFTNVTVNPAYCNWVLDDYSFHDVPAVLRFVRQKTGQEKVFWVGHSMGGIIMLCYLIKNPDSNICGLVTVGSQLTMPPGQLVNDYINQLQFLRLAELSGDSEKMKAARKVAEDTSNDMFFSPSNRDPQVISMLNSIGTDTPGVGVLGQYLELIASGELKTFDNSFNFAQNAQEISVPYLIMGGAADCLAPPQVQQYLYRSVSSTDKQVVILGNQDGFSVDYGHNDSLISQSAKSEVYPVILKWLDEHCPNSGQNI